MLEEVDEYFENGNSEELADIIDVVHDILETIECLLRTSTRN